MLRFFLVSFCLALWAVTVPVEVSAQVQGFYICEGTQCSACDLVRLANQVIVWLIGVLFMLFAVLIFIAGFRLVTSGGNQDAMTKAKNSMVNAIIGILIVLSAWLIVDTLFRGLNVTYRGGPFPWSQVSCQQQMDAHAPLPGATPVIDPRQTPIQNQVGQARPQQNCPNCEDMSGFVSCVRPTSCTIDATYAQRLRAVLQASGERMQVTEGFPPARENHQNACHNNGTCVDIVFQDRQWNQQRIEQFQAVAQANGCRAVFEPPAGVGCFPGSYVPNRGNGNTCLPHSITRSSGNHFSLYCN
jgi:hypothetical protein